MQKSDTDRALLSPRQLQAGECYGWIERRMRRAHTGSDVTIGPEGRGSRSNGAITDSSE